MRSKHAWNRVLRWGVVALLVGMLLPASGYGITVAHAQEATGSYTSATLGYTITWDAAWQVNEQSGDATSDSLSLVDGRSFVFFSGRADGSDAQAAIDSFAAFLLADDSFADTQPRADCPGGGRAIPSVTACFTYLRLYDDGDAVPEAALLEAWDLGNGVRLLMVATVAQELFDGYLPVWAAFGIVPAGQAAAPGVAPAELDGVTFTFEPGVTDADRADVVEGIRLGQEIISAYLGLENLRDIQVTVRETASAEREFAVAATLGYEIEVYAGGQAWQYAPVLIRIETLVHELMHVYQNQLLGPGERGVPLWFDEGAAEAMGYLAITQLGVLNQDDVYQLASYLLTRFPVDGSLEQFAPYGSLTTDAYPLSYIAVQYLLGRSGRSVSALGEFYRAVSNGVTVDDAFLAAFGISLDEYYVEFDAWRLGLQSAQVIPDDFSPSLGSAQQATADWLQVQTQVDRGDQLVAVVATSPGAICTLDLSLGQNAIERETFANDDGEAFWLVTIPTDAPVGPAMVTVSCGASPVTATVEVR